MAKGSTIEWTDHTFNPWWGCTKVSPGCAHCYAEAIARRFSPDIWGPNRQRRIFGNSHWAEVLAWDRQAERRGTPSRVFCASMADVFDPEAPEFEVETLFRFICSTPNLIWQLLTKRPERILRTIPREWTSVAPENVWYGTSIENADYLWRASALCDVPAQVRFLSLEPLLGPLHELPLAGIQWVIVGGESGRQARPMRPEWAREIRDQCVAQGVPFFFKQWGEWNETGERAGKKQSGHELDGEAWTEFPET